LLSSELSNAADKGEALEKVHLLRLANLTRNVNADILQEICSCFGEVRQIELINYPRTEKFKGVAYVTYSTDAEARAAL
jgi:RNA recognition motif-containing protein